MYKTRTWTRSGASKRSKKPFNAVSARQPRLRTPRYIHSPLAKNIPDEVIKVILEYLKSNDPINTIFLCKERDTFLNGTLRKYMNGFMETTIYSAISIKYFRHQCKKDMNNPNGCLFKSNVTLKISKQQCCAKTKTGKRCKKNTFMLFCNCHKDPKVYWI